MMSDIDGYWSERHSLKLKATDQAAVFHELVVRMCWVPWVSLDIKISHIGSFWHLLEALKPP